MANSWSDAEVLCRCRSKTEYLRDEDHDGGSCEIFKCLAGCGTIHVELPD